MYNPADNAPPRLSQDLSQAMKASTGKRWVISVSAQPGEPTLAQIDEQAENQLRQNILEHL